MEQLFTPALLSLMDQVSGGGGDLGSWSGGTVWIWGRGGLGARGAEQARLQPRRRAWVREMAPCRLLARPRLLLTVAASSFSGAGVRRACSAARMGGLFTDVRAPRCLSKGTARRSLEAASASQPTAGPTHVYVRVRVRVRVRRRGERARERVSNELCATHIRARSRCAHHTRNTHALPLDARLSSRCSQSSPAIRPPHSRI